MKIVEDALTFDDVLLLPAYSNVLPKDVSLETKLTREITLNIPLASAAMDTVTEARLAIALGQEGGIGIIHKSMTIERQAEEVRKVKKFESGIVTDPITISPYSTLDQLLAIVNKYQISGLPVVDGDDVLGIITKRDWRFETDLSKKVSSLMTKKEDLVTVNENVTREEVINIFRDHRIEKVLMVDDKFHLRGMITVKDLQKAKEKPFASKDKSGRIIAGAAVGTSKDTHERVKALVDAGVDVIVVDTAHGHSEGVLQTVTWVKKTYPNVQVIGGNVATAAGALALVKAGADGVKVGIGPGSICTTRIVAGVGVPQISAVANVAKALAGTGVPVIADGGIRYSGDIAKVIAAGANVVMVGGLLAGTDEAPGEIILFQGRSYKTYRGMGSIGAMAQTSGSSDRYFQGNINDADKLVPEGIEGRVPYKGSMLTVVHQLMGGLRSSMGYTGSESIPYMQKNAEFVKITSAGMRESHVHDVTITKEAPNYRSE